MHRIGAFSQLSKVTVKALRYYDEVGLLKPAHVDQWTGYRLYDTAQLIPLQRIVALRQAGLTIDEITAILSGQDGPGILTRRRSELHSELQEATLRLSRLESIIHQEDFFMDYQATVRTLPGCTVFYRSGVIPTYAQLTEFILEAGAQCAAANPTLKCVEPSYCFITYEAGEYQERDVAMTYHQAVTAKGVETDEIHFKELCPVEAVCVYHKGAYDRLGEAYAFALTWLEQNGYQLTERPRECYISGCWDQEDPANYLTELQFPVKKK